MPFSDALDSAVHFIQLPSMHSASRDHPDWLPRLSSAAYQGFAAVHWQMTIDQRRQGWLGAELHLSLRETLLHTMVRNDLICPIYCLMPDHMHLLWMGTSTRSDQRKAARFFRTHVNVQLHPARFQKQAYDHVLRQSEKGPDAVRETAHYIQQNPVRAGIVQNASDWPFLGAMLPGYPAMDPRTSEFWPLFWKIRSHRIAANRESDT